MLKQILNTSLPVAIVTDLTQYQSTYVNGKTQHHCTHGNGKADLTPVYWSFDGKTDLTQVLCAPSSALPESGQDTPFKLWAWYAYAFQKTFSLSPLLNQSGSQDYKDGPPELKYFDKGLRIGLFIKLWKVCKGIRKHSEHSGAVINHQTKGEEAHQNQEGESS